MKKSSLFGARGFLQWRRVSSSCLQSSSCDWRSDSLASRVWEVAKDSKLLVYAAAVSLSLQFSPASAATITAADIVTVDGKDWAQVSLFTGLSWNDINAVCPAGSCSGALNGWDVTGWSWASLSDVGDLFAAATSFPGGYARYEEAGSTWAPAWFDNLGFNPTSQSTDGNRGTTGLTVTIVAPAGPSYSAFIPYLIDNITYAVVTTQEVWGTDLSSGSIGAWLYRPVPLPASGPLALSGLALFGWFARRRKQAIWQQA